MKLLISEGKRDEALGMFLPLFQNRGIEINISQLKQYLLNKFVVEAGMHTLSEGSNYYLLGVAKYYFAGNLTTNKKLNALYPNVKDRFNANICQRLDALVGILRGMYIDSVGTKFEQPEDFGNLTIDQLFKKYNKAINKALGLDVKTEKEVIVKEPKISKSVRVGRKYTYDILYSYDDARKYKMYTEPGAWCITYGKQHFDGYVKRLNIHYVIFIEKGFENIPRQKGKGWTKQKPQDAYGNSLIAVLQSNKNGEPIFITSRWNHGTFNDGTSCEADHAYTKEEFFRVTGCDDATLQRAFEQWKAEVKNRKGGEDNIPLSKKEQYAKKLDVLRTFKYAQMMINGGANLKDYVYGGSIIRDAKNFKGTYLVYIRKNNEVYSTIMDRKQMFFNEYLVESNYPSNLKCCSCSKYCILTDGTWKNYYIFDLIHHCFLNLDGCIKFRTIDSTLRYSQNEEGIRYGIVAQSGNQIALINLQTMKPIKSRNGSCWFESITNLSSFSNSNVDYRGRISINSVRGNEILKMVYDSASGEVYLFDTNKGDFIETKNGEDGFHMALYQRHSSEGFIKYVKGDLTERDGKGLIRYQRVSNSSWFTVGGYDTFKEIEWDSFVVGYKGYDEDIAHYVDGKTGLPLEIEGREVTTSSVSMMKSGEWLAISLSDSANHNFWEQVILFNPISRTIYHDNISGWYFCIYGANIAYYPNSRPEHYYDRNSSDNNRYKLPTPQEDAMNMEEKKTEIQNRFNDILNRMN